MVAKVDCHLSIGIVGTLLILPAQTIITIDVCNGTVDEFRSPQTDGRVAG